MKKNKIRNLVIFSTIICLSTCTVAKNVKASGIKYLNDTTRFIKEIDNDDFFIAAHRGFSSLEIENSANSIICASNEEYIDYIEIDVRMTKDKELILSHDEKIKSNSMGRISVSNTNSNQLCNDTYKYNFTNLNIRDIGCVFNKESVLVIDRNSQLLNKSYQIISLDDGIDLCGNKKILLDLKFNDDTKDFINSLDLELKDRDISNIIFQSDEIESLLYLKDIHPEYECSVIISNKKDLKYTDYFENVTLRNNLVSYDLVNSLLDDGKGVMIWTLNNTDKIDKAILELDNLYDEVVYITDYPDVLVKELNKTKKKKK